MSAHTNIRKHVLAAFIALGASIAALLLASSSAGAFIGRPTFGSPFGDLTAATGLTVDQSTGNVFVIDNGAQEVRVFGSEGGAPAGGGPSSFTGAGTPAKTFTFNYQQEPSFDSKNHVLYIPNAGNGSVDKFKFEGSEWKYICDIVAGGVTGQACQADATSSGSEEEPFIETMGTAVDSAGDLYVAPWRNATAYEFNPAGEQIASFPLGFNPQYIAVGPTGTLYVNVWQDGPVLEFKRKSLTGPVEGEATSVLGGAGAMAVDDATGNVILDRGSFVEEFNSKDELVGSTVAGGLGGSEGVGVNETTNHLYAVDNGAKDVVQFGLGVVLPDATTDAASAIEQTTATLNGAVNPDKVAKTSYWFEYGTSSEPYAVITPEVEIAGAPEEPKSVSLPISGLKAGTVYHYRVMTRNPNGVNPGGDISFETLPPVAGLNDQPATGVTTESAILNGGLEPNGLETTCWYQYGPGFAFNLETPKEGAGKQLSGEKPFSQTVSALLPNTEYRYRLVCENSLGTGTATVEGSLQPLQVAPEVLSVQTSNVSRQRAVLIGEINPENAATTYYFEYGLDNKYGYKTEVSQLPSSTAGEVRAQGVAVELKSNTLYHYRLVAQSGTLTTQGADATFTSGTLTPPTVVTGGVSGVSPSGATLEGTVSTQGLLTSYGFEISTEKGSFGPPTGLGSIGAGFSQAQATLVLHGLQPITTYFYKIVGTNVDGTTEGLEEEFTTAAYPPDEITVEQLRVLTEPFTSWPAVTNLLYLKAAPKVVKPKKKAKKKKRKGKNAKGQGKRGKSKRKT